MMDSWTPLEDQWRSYFDQLIEANDAGLLDDEESADEYGYPEALTLGDTEKTELGDFAFRRTAELNEIFNHFGLQEKAIGSYLMNAVLVGMLWERERIGR